MNYIQSRVTYVLAAHAKQEYGIPSIFASFYGFSSGMIRGVNWLRVDLSSVGLFMINTFIFTSPAIIGGTSASFGGINVPISRGILRIIAQFTTLVRGNEVFMFESELRDLDTVKGYIRSIVSDIDKYISSGDLHTFGYAIPNFVDSNVTQLQMQRIKIVLNGYLNARSSSELATMIAVSYSNLSSVSSIGEHSSRVGDLQNIIESNANTAALGMRKYIPITATRVAFSGEPSLFALSMFKLFVKGVSVVFDDGVRVVVNSPSFGCNVVVVDEASQGSWLVNLLSSMTAESNLAEQRSVNSESQTKELKSTNIFTSGRNGIESIIGNRKDNTFQKRSYSASSAPPLAQGGDLYLFVGGPTPFRLVGKLI